MEGLIRRQKYMDAIEPFAWNGNAKVITGIRRCGKSSLLELIRNGFDSEVNVIHINTEFREYSEIRDWKIFLDLVDSGYRENVKNVLIVDEIQNIDGWELAVRDLIAKRKFDIYLTGSNSNLLSSEYATHLGGRYNRIRMLPLSYRECVEFATAFGLDGDVLERYMRLGGFPINWISDVPVRSALQTVSDIADVIISVDINRRFNVRNPSLLNDIFRTILSMTGSYVSSNKIYNTLKSSGFRTSVDTVNEYIKYLETANLLIRADVYDLKGRRILENKRKYYAADLSLKHAVLGYRPEDISGHLENIVFTELLYRGYDVYVGDYNGKEIDIVAEKTGERMYVQCCTSISNESTMKREFGNLEHIDDSFPKYVVMMEPGPYSGITDKGIICCGLKEFLEERV